MSYIPKCSGNSDTFSKHNDTEYEKNIFLNGTSVGLGEFSTKKIVFFSIQQVPFYGEVMCRPHWFDTPFGVWFLCYNHSKYQPKISNILRDWACQTWSNALNPPDLRDLTTGLCSRVLYRGKKNSDAGPGGP